MLSFPPSERTLAKEPPWIAEGKRRVHMYTAGIQRVRRWTAPTNRVFGLLPPFLFLVLLTSKPFMLHKRLTWLLMKRSAIVRHSHSPPYSKLFETAAVEINRDVSPCRHKINPNALARKALRRQNLCEAFAYASRRTCSGWHSAELGVATSFLSCSCLFACFKSEDDQWVTKEP